MEELTWEEKHKRDLKPDNIMMRSLIVNKDSDSMLELIEIFLSAGTICPDTYNTYYGKSFFSNVLKSIPIFVWNHQLNRELLLYCNSGDLSQEFKDEIKKVTVAELYRNYWDVFMFFIYQEKDGFRIFIDTVVNETLVSLRKEFGKNRDYALRHFPLPEEIGLSRNSEQVLVQEKLSSAIKAYIK